jgi:hypothetical protein
VADPTYGPPTFTANQVDDLGLLSVPIAADAGSPQAVRAVDALRQRYVPQAFAGVDARVLVGGGQPTGATSSPWWTDTRPSSSPSCWG